MAIVENGSNAFGVLTTLRHQLYLAGNCSHDVDWMFIPKATRFSSTRFYHINTEAEPELSQ
jgi:hypothetical protein